MADDTTLADTSPFAPHEEPRLRLPSLYRIAGDLQTQLEKTPGGLTKMSTTTLTPAQVGSFNQLLADARAVLPDSVALREDVGEVDTNTRLLDAHHALKTTLVPTLHNALPNEAYDKTG